MRSAAFQVLARRRRPSLGRALLARALAPVAAILILCGAGAPAAGQEPIGPVVRTAAYDDDLRTLAEVMGGAHYLNSVCSGPGDQTWRLNMQSLLDREGPPGSAIRLGMITAFNEGYKAQQNRYGNCDSAARAATVSLARRGKNVARVLASRNY
jgi:uncharacterized protein (TIGR02301 family)